MKTIFLPLLCAAAVTSLQGKIVTKSVDYTQGGAHLQGYLAYDDEKTSAGERPGVLVIHEWWGLTDYVKHRAEQLAKLGYVAFAADMYGQGKVTTDPKQAQKWAGQFYGRPLMAERAQAGLDQLLQTGLVDPARIAAIGYCFGGSACQALAYSGASLAGIVSFHGGLIPVPADVADKNKAKILICQGALDPHVPKADIDAFLNAMNEAKVDYQFHLYSGAVHAFTNPDATALAAATGMKGIGYNAAADRRSWADMKMFFHEIFGPAPSGS